MHASISSLLHSLMCKCLFLYCNNCPIFFIAVANSFNGGKPTLDQVDDYSIKVSWTTNKEIPSELSKYYGYTVKYGIIKDDFPYAKNVSHQASTGNQSTTINNLDLQKLYYFRVIPYRTVRQSFFEDWASDIAIFHPLGE